MLCNTQVVGDAFYLIQLIKKEILMKYLVEITILLFLLPSLSWATENKNHEENEAASGVEALSDDLRNLLSQEMKALQDGMMSIIPAYVSGNWGEIEETALKMKGSYILKQSLSEDQVKELHSALPHEFIEKDKRFHYLAGMLAHAAKNKKSELINFYFSEMNESCMPISEVHTLEQA
jgi:hypothetical protein